MIELVKKEIEGYERKTQSWIIEGFPRTKVQAMSLQRMKVIPDRIMSISYNQRKHIEALVSQLGGTMEDEEIVAKAAQIVDDYETKLAGVTETYKSFIYNIEGSSSTANEISEGLTRVLKVKFRKGAPRRTPGAVIIGPPGSGKTTQARCLADSFGLVLVSPFELLREEIKRNPPIRTRITAALEKGEPVPDDILLRLVDARLKKTDCCVNGWVLDGFPETETQINLLDALRIDPDMVFMFEMNERECTRRLANRRVDSLTGEQFSEEPGMMPKKGEIIDRLVSERQDCAETVGIRYKAWCDNLTQLEETYYI